MNPFASDHPLHSVTATLLARESTPLCPKQPHIKGLLTGATGSYKTLAALHLLNDDLDAAHRLVQPHEDDATANYLHQLVHRREGDWSNTRYWVGKTGNHPFYAEFGQGGSARERVDLCERAARASDESAAARLTWDELTGLLAWCVAHEE